MLHTLTIRNVALIEDLTLEFGSGLNVLTGETGAGKSVILEALELALGKRAAGEYIRTGSEKAFVEAVFSVKETPACLAGAGIEPEEGFLFFCRELYRHGRSLCRINGRAVPLALCREAAEELIDFLGQGEQQVLYHPVKQGEIFDAFAGLSAARSELARTYQRWRAVKEKAEAQARRNQERLRRADTLRYQIKEIDAAALQPGEMEELLQEREWLRNAAQLTELALHGRDLLSGEDRSAVETMGEAAGIVAEIARFRSGLKPYAEALSEAVQLAGEAARELEQLADQAEYSPERLDAVEERLEAIKKLGRKYGETVDEILRYREAAAVELQALEQEEEEGSLLQEEAERLRREWEEKAAELRTEREKAGPRLEERMSRELENLAMGKTIFKVVFQPLPETPNPRGLEEIEFYFSPNPGEPPKPLNRIASGGEAARAIFALKTLIAAGDRVDTLFLDEVDAGISGEALAAMADRLDYLAGHQQVLCITHQAVLAARAGVHYVIQKETQDDRAVTRVVRLEGEARVRELARLVGGVPETALEHARRLAKL
ncbi:MAG: DNA repair protein RecN [Bacillota bacterium]